MSEFPGQGEGLRWSDFEDSERWKVALGVWWRIAVVAVGLWIVVAIVVTILALVALSVGE